VITGLAKGKKRYAISDSAQDPPQRLLAQAHRNGCALLDFGSAEKRHQRPQEDMLFHDAAKDLGNIMAQYPQDLIT
jgi:acyl-homoserine lactone acylase PvdQ